jgi:hypothetical protein
MNKYIDEKGRSNTTKYVRGDKEWVTINNVADVLLGSNVIWNVM